MKTCRSRLHEYSEELDSCPECLKQGQVRWRANNRDKIAEARKRYKEKHRDKVNEAKARYRAKNGHVIREYNRKLGPKRKYYQDRFAAKKGITYKEYRRLYEHRRKTNDPIYKLRHTLSVRIHAGLKSRGYKKSSKVQSILGANFNTVHTHLILSALRNYGVWIEGYKYDIDHIIPQASAKSEEELIKLSHYTNLQYLYPKDNVSKHARLDWVLK